MKTNAFLASHRAAHTLTCSWSAQLGSRSPDSTTDLHLNTSESQLTGLLRAFRAQESQRLVSGGGEEAGGEGERTQREERIRAHQRRERGILTRGFRSTTRSQDTSKGSREEAGEQL